MIRGLHTAAAGMTAQQRDIDVISNNIANVNTTGFKKDRTEFQDLMYQSLNYTAGATGATTVNPTGIDTGLGVRVSGIQKEFLQGNLTATGNAYDIAIEGVGFFKVTNPDTGDEFYTRNGSFKLRSDGVLVNHLGYELTPQINVYPNEDNPYVSISIAADGTVSGQLANGETEALGELVTYNFTNPAGLAPQGNSLYLNTSTSGEPVEGQPSINGFGSLAQAYIEGSNVELVEEMVNLITAQRGYEANSKSIQTTDSMLQIVNQLKRS
jgi:flagellar basal-body rod protein FlgG